MGVLFLSSHEGKCFFNLVFSQSLLSGFLQKASKTRPWVSWPSPLTFHYKICVKNSQDSWYWTEHIIPNSNTERQYSKPVTSQLLLVTNILKIPNMLLWISSQLPGPKWKTQERVAKADLWAHTKVIAHWTQTIGEGYSGSAICKDYISAVLV